MMAATDAHLPHFVPALGSRKDHRTATLERDDFSSNRHPALPLCLSMSFFARPVPTFAGHALRVCFHALQLTKRIERANRNQFETHEVGLSQR